MSKTFNKLGVRGSQTSEVVFKDCGSASCVLGQEGQGFRIAMSALDVGRIGIAAMATSITQACLDESVRYSKLRVQFNKPIAKQQAIQWFIANMSTDVDTSRSLHVCRLVERWANHSTWLHPGQAVLFGMHDQTHCKAVQIQGGYGYDRPRSNASTAMSSNRDR